ncbi:hypothetical protein OG205_09075 [Lentzea sp. NBC_00516]|uniref:hypothetical protein n=1 Tax=Lentzea sp. NBC_00516 TaxID=2903582 RepID=UPI002E80DBA8|nr:hypothetical protein [Lentzea sp. NBC_00516]WUD27128.1 hypothetical protein OG205_09075 [Lentzea sp. NBC_00516]
MPIATPARLSAVARREIRYVDLPVDEFAKRLVALGVPEAFAGDVASLFADVAGGRLEATTPDLAGLIGRAVRQVWSTEVHTFE